MADGCNETREKVLDSAIRTFARRGYAGTSVQDILDATGLSKPTLYYHFENKAGLYRAILDHAYDECFALMRNAAERGREVGSRLVEVTFALFEFALRQQDLMRLVFATAFAASEEIPADAINPARRRRNFDFMKDLLAAGQRTGEIDPGVDPVELTHAIYGAISHCLRMHLFTPSGRLDRARAERMVDLFLNGARSRAAMNS